MHNYQIIDEPKESSLNSLIVNPIIILFAALVVPIFINLPLYARLWVPILWIVFNSFFLGSPTKVKEIVIAISGIAILIGIHISIIVLANNNIETAKSAAPYLRITIQGVLFFTLCLIASYQATPYAIHEYIKEQSR